MENILITTAKCCLKIKAGKTHRRIKSLSNKKWFDKKCCLKRHELCTYQCKACGGRGRGRQGMGWGFDIFQFLPSNSLPTGKSFQSNSTKFPLPGLHIAIKYPKAEPKKGTMKIFPNKTLQSLFITLLHHQTYIDVPVTAAIIRFNHNPCYTA